MSKNFIDTTDAPFIRFPPTAECSSKSNPHTKRIKCNYIIKIHQNSSPPSPAQSEKRRKTENRIEISKIKTMQPIHSHQAQTRNSPKHRTFTYHGL